MQTLNQLTENQTAKVVILNGGRGLIDKLDALGIRKGKVLTKISNSFVGGPVTIQIGTAKIAIGYKMAAKIMVEGVKR